MEEEIKQEMPVQEEVAAPAAPAKPVQPKEKTYNLVFTETEILTRVQKLQSSENLNMFLRVEDGRQEYAELVELSKLIPK